MSPDPSGPGARATSRTLTRFAPGGRARLHQPDYAFSLLGASPVPAKSLLATIALALAAVQVLLALWIYGKLPLPGPPRQVPLAHRLTGTAVLAVTVPVAGCFFYGAFAAKVVAVRSRRLPGWVLPAAGGTLAIVLGVLWYTSALWYYNGYHLPRL